MNSPPTGDDFAHKDTILIVDDLAANRLALNRLLRMEDRRIIEAESGFEALRQLLKEDVQLILLDVEMPEMDGFETAELIRGNPRLEQVPIIFQTAHGTDARTVKGYQLGGVDFIQKPIVPAVLRARVNVFLQLHDSVERLKAIRAQLGHAEVRVHALLEIMTEAFIMVDRTGKIEMCSLAAEKLFCYSSSSKIVGASAATIVAEANTRAPIFDYDSVSRFVGTWSQVVGLRQDGSSFPVEISVSRVNTGQEQFFCARLRDLTEVAGVTDESCHLSDPQIIDHC